MEKELQKRHISVACTASGHAYLPAGRFGSSLFIKVSVCMTKESREKRTAKETCAFDMCVVPEAPVLDVVCVCVCVCVCVFVCCVRVFVCVCVCCCVFVSVRICVCTVLF